jgi:hypothetical protein
MVQWVLSWRGVQKFQGSLYIDRWYPQARRHVWHLSISFYVHPSLKKYKHNIMVCVPVSMVCGTARVWEVKEFMHHFQVSSHTEILDLNPKFFHTQHYKLAGTIRYDLLQVLHAPTHILTQKWTDIFFCLSASLFECITDAHHRSY